MPDRRQLAHWIRQVRSLPPREVLKRGALKAARLGAGRQEQLLDALRPTYLSGRVPAPALSQHFRMPDLGGLVDRDWLAGISRHYLDHRFDLLGSGWVVIRHGMTCRGLGPYRYRSDAPNHPPVNRSNRREAARLRSLIAEPYEPIDWQLDFKSGWRWSETTRSRGIQYGRLPGVDVKVPWELARMQHLPQLAVAAGLAASGDSGFEAAARYAREFRSQVLDFIAANPPRYGVNWVTTMDVAIRVVNWLAAFDLFRDIGQSFDRAFEEELGRSVLEHGRHIAAHLEWSAEVRGNHYLADVVGLIVVGAYLPSSRETDAWLGLGIQELIAEVEHQFNPDGSNFEASTAYHRLSAELVTYAAALVLGLDADRIDALSSLDYRAIRTTPPLRQGPVPLYPTRDGSNTPLPPRLFERLQGMAEFTGSIAKPTGLVPQVGDNDNGRLLKFFPVYRPRPVHVVREGLANLDGYADLPDDAVYWEENHLDHGHLVEAINGVLAGGRSDDRFEYDITRSMADHRPAVTSVDIAPRASHSTVGDDQALAYVEGRIAALPKSHRRTVVIGIPGGGLRESLEQRAFTDFGLYVFASDRIYLAVRCGPIGQDGFGGHAHNDQLSIELSVDGDDWIRDPGTYVYTPLPASRNAYRSAAAHFGPRLEGPEPARLDVGLFRLGSAGFATCRYWGDRGFAGDHRTADGRTAICRVVLCDDRIEVTHAAEGATLAEGTMDWRANVPGIAFSPGYGIVER